MHISGTFLSRSLSKNLTNADSCCFGAQESGLVSTWQLIPPRPEGTWLPKEENMRMTLGDYRLQSERSMFFEILKVLKGLKSL